LNIIINKGFIDKKVQIELPTVERYGVIEA